MGIETAIVLAVVAAGSSIAQHNQQKKALNEQKSAQELERRIQERKNAKERIDQIRKARVANASAIAEGAATGTLNSSNTVGNQSSVSSQLGSNLSFLSSQQQDSNQAFDYMGDATNHMANANTYGAISNLAVSAGSATGAFSNLGKAMAGSPSTNTVTAFDMPDAGNADIWSSSQYNFGDLSNKG